MCGNQIALYRYRSNFVSLRRYSALCAGGLKATTMDALIYMLLVIVNGKFVTGSAAGPDKGMCRASDSD